MPAQASSAAKKSDVSKERWIGRVDLVEPGHDDLVKVFGKRSGLAKAASSP
jgi:hypothetical protein